MSIEWHFLKMSDVVENAESIELLHNFVQEIGYLELM